MYPETTLFSFLFHHLLCVMYINYVCLRQNAISCSTKKFKQSKTTKRSVKKEKKNHSDKKVKLKHFSWRGITPNKELNTISVRFTFRLEHYSEGEISYSFLSYEIENFKRV